MFARRKKGPTRPFAHADDCKILKADPGVEIPWSEVESGHWRAVCVCGTQDYYEPVADRRARLDPLDPSTSRHAGQCEFASETDRGVLRVALKVKPGLDEGYDWVECAGCDCGWQVPHHAPGSIG
jgi:hypothetical protein